MSATSWPWPTTLLWYGSCSCVLYMFDASYKQQAVVTTAAGVRVCCCCQSADIVSMCWIQQVYANCASKAVLVIDHVTGCLMALATCSCLQVRFYYSFTSRDNLYIVMEYLNGGDCFSLLRVLGALDEDTARLYVAETVLALEYCHTQVLSYILVPAALHTCSGPHARPLFHYLSEYSSLCCLSAPVCLQKTCRQLAVLTLVSRCKRVMQLACCCRQ